MGMLKNALGAVREVTQSGGRILFVGTKRQASEQYLKGISMLNITLIIDGLEEPLQIGNDIKYNSKIKINSRNFR